MKYYFQKILDLLILLGSTILFSAVVCFLLDYKLFDLNNFGFQLFFYSLLASFTAFAHKYLKQLEIIIISLGWGFVFAYLLRRTSVQTDFKNFVNLLIYTELLTISFAVIFITIWKQKKFHLRGLLFSISAAAVYGFVHFMMHQILDLPIGSRQILYYFSNGLVIMLTISLALNTAEMLSHELDKYFFRSDNQ